MLNIFDGYSFQLAIGKEQLAGEVILRMTDEYNGHSVVYVDMPWPLIHSGRNGSGEPESILLRLKGKEIVIYCLKSLIFTS